MRKALEYICRTKKIKKYKNIEYFVNNKILIAKLIAYINKNSINCSNKYAVKL